MLLCLKIFWPRQKTDSKLNFKDTDFRKPTYHFRMTSSNIKDSIASKKSKLKLPKNIYKILQNYSVVKYSTVKMFFFV